MIKVSEIKRYGSKRQASAETENKTISNEELSKAIEREIIDYFETYGVNGVRLQQTEVDWIIAGALKRLGFGDTC